MYRPSTCLITKTPIQPGEDIVCFLLVENLVSERFHQPGSLYRASYIPIYGKYNIDSNSIVDWHSPAMEDLIDSVRAQLYEVGHRPSTPDDIFIQKATLDFPTILNGIQKRRLFKEDYSRINGEPETIDLENFESLIETGVTLTEAEQFEYDRLTNRIAEEIDPVAKIDIAMIRRSAFNSITTDWKNRLEKKAGDIFEQAPVCKLSLGDVLADIPNLVKLFEDIDQISYSSVYYALKEYLGPAGLILYRRTSSWRITKSDPLVRLIQLIEQYGMNKDWTAIQTLIEEVTKGIWIDRFMSFTNLHWIPAYITMSTTAELSDRQFLNEMTRTLLK